MSSFSKTRRRSVLGGLCALLAAVSAGSLASGVIPTGLREVLAALPDALLVAITPMLNRPYPSLHGDAGQLILILAEIRIPRLLLALMVGAGLAMCGAVMQGLFRNPMADPGLLGVSSGAALGAVMSIVLGGALFASGLFGALLLPVAAFAGGLAGLALVYRLSLVGGKTDTATMLLAGIAVNAIAGALIGLMSYLADDEQLRGLIFWSLGSLEAVDWRALLAAMLLVIPALALLPFYAGALNANLLGESEAGHLGIDMEKVKRHLVILVALVVGAAVCLSGVIGFVGLVVPHLIRIALGPDHRLLLPASALFGAVLLGGADILARTAAAPAEIPVGIITAALGGPFFLWLLLRFRRARVAQ
ncbi:MAG: iron ABC transporter permease [Gammaproteobacteria bacterium]|nr:iron ABC transporter permease [Gammaproteobacteria bacterium]